MENTEPLCMPALGEESFPESSLTKVTLDKRETRGDLWGPSGPLVTGLQELMEGRSAAALDLAGILSNAVISCCRV